MELKGICSLCNNWPCHLGIIIVAAAIGAAITYYVLTSKNQKSK